MSMNLDGFVQKRTVITIGTKEFTFTELTIADYAELKAHLTAERENLCEKRRQRLIQDAAKIGSVDTMELLKLTDSTISEDELEAHAYTVEGIGFLAFLSLRHEHIEISRDQVMQIVTLESIDEITAAMFPMNQSEKAKKKLRPRQPIMKKKKKKTKKKSHKSQQ